jgi:hypothetical protein
MVKVMKIDIYAKPDTTKPSGYDVWMEENSRKTDRLVFDKTKDNMKKTENYDVRFKLHNKDNANLRFATPTDKALWAKPVEDLSEPCPDQACFMNGVFYLDSVDRDELSVINTDPAAQLFKFAINLVPEGTVEDENTTYVWFDPIGENRNGGLPG